MNTGILSRASRLLLPLLLLVMLVDTVWATPVTVSDPYLFRDNRSGGATGLLTGDFLQIGFGLLPSSVPPGTTATVETVATGETFAMEPCATARDRCAFFAFIPYSSARADSDYLIEAFNGLDSGSLLVSAYGTGAGTGALPFVENVSVTDNGLTPIINWDIPVELVNHNAGNICPASNGTELNDCNVNRLRVRVWEEDPSISTGLREIFDTSVDLGLSLPLDATSYQLPPGYITDPGSYQVGVFIEGFDPFNRSRVRENFTIVAVPAPTTITLMAIGLLGLRIRCQRLTLG